MSEPKQHINLQLDAHRLSMDIPRSDEEAYRRAAKWLNRLYQFYLKNYPSASAEKLWVYVALNAGFRYMSDEREKAIEPIEKKMNDINKLIEQKLC